MPNPISLCILVDNKERRRNKCDSYFSGVTKQHKLPHIHVKYQEDEVVVELPSGEVLEGNIPNTKMKLLQAWIELHKDELLADWELAASGQQPYKIDPLR